MHLTKSDIENTEKVRRLNLINSITGIKPVNLIGSISGKGESNLAIFSSVVHLGSNPALLGFIIRPSGLVKRDTADNILETGYYTINHVHESFAERAHYTSAKFEKSESEFVKCHLTEEFIYNFKAPFVKESRVKLGMKFLEQIPIKINGTAMIVGEIEHLIVEDSAVNDAGYLDLSAVNNIGLSGLNTYYQLNKIASYPYARVEDLPDFSRIF
jgi:flavin reductase (DIM6/NTAB) family NADH-FMN oxidoreductase RutF